MLTIPVSAFGETTHMRMKLSHLLVGAILALSCSVEAQTCSTSNYGQGCGPVANGTTTPQGNHVRFSFTMSQATPGAALLLVVGVSQTQTPLPFTSCFLLTELAFTQGHTIGSDGTWTFEHSLPYGPGGFVGQACVQFIEVSLNPQNQFVVRPTNGVLMVCN